MDVEHAHCCFAASVAQAAAAAAATAAVRGAVAACRRRRRSRPAQPSASPAPALLSCRRQAFCDCAAPGLPSLLQLSGQGQTNALQVRAPCPERYVHCSQGSSAVWRWVPGAAGGHCERARGTRDCVRLGALAAASCTPSLLCAVPAINPVAAKEHPLTWCATAAIRPLPRPPPPPTSLTQRCPSVSPPSPTRCPALQRRSVRSLRHGVPRRQGRRHHHCVRGHALNGGRAARCALAQRAAGRPHADAPRHRIAGRAPSHMAGCVHLPRGAAAASWATAESPPLRVLISSPSALPRPPSRAPFVA